jgi:hypothetical protein
VKTRPSAAARHKRVESKMRRGLAKRERRFSPSEE